MRRYDEEGREATVSYYNSPESAAGEWYVFIYDENDQAIAHPNQDLKGDLGVDVVGYRFGEVMVGAGEQGLWVDFMFLNPATGNQEFKHAWVVRHDGLLFASGRHQDRPCGVHGGRGGPGHPLLQGPRPSGSGAVLQHAGKRRRGLVCLCR